MSTFGERARQLMTERGVSVRELARRTYFDKGHISRVLNGHKPPSDEFARRLDEELGASGALLALAGVRSAQGTLGPRSGSWGRDEADELAAMLATATVAPGTAVRIAHEWLITDPPQILEVAAGRRIGENLAAKAEARVIQLRRLDDHLGGGDLADLVEKELAATTRLLAEASYTCEIGRRLLVVVGELAQLAGWVLSDDRRHAAAARAYLAGAQAAHAAGDQALAGQLLSSLSYQEANVGNPRDAVLLARSAYKGAERHATPRVRALLADRVAWTHAKTGEADLAERALGAADDALAEADGHEDPDWVYWVNRDELDIMAGRVYTELRRPLKAAPLLTSTLERYDASHARERSLYLTWLAETYVYAGELEAASSTASEALHLAGTVNSARGRQRVLQVGRRLRPHRQSAAVRAFLDEFDDGGP